MATCASGRPCSWPARASRPTSPHEVKLPPRPGDTPRSPLLDLVAGKLPRQRPRPRRQALPSC
jgi:hypothetical protein